MITKETLESINNGIVTDQQIQEGITHYAVLLSHLECHGELYELVRRDTYLKLEQLRSWDMQRKLKKL